tara:strand:+ start:11892 stop:12179 length:288 start_codon:yes stop_codon:yes gene_type:complete
MKIKIPKTKQFNKQKYQLSLVTEDYCFYSNYKDNNPGSNTLYCDRATNKTVKPINQSQGFGFSGHAYIGLCQILASDKYVWASKKLLSLYIRKTK